MLIDSDYIELGFLLREELDSAVRGFRRVEKKWEDLNDRRITPFEREKAIRAYSNAYVKNRSQMITTNFSSEELGILIERELDN